MAAGEVWAAEFFCDFWLSHDGEVGGGRGDVFFHDAPDAAALAVAAGVVEGDFVVADDAVVEIGDVERAVGAEGEIDGAEPGIVAGKEVGLLVGLRRGAGEGDVVVIDLGGDDVAEEEVVVPFGAPDAAVDVNDAANAGGAVGVLAHDGGETEAFMRFAKAGVMRTAQELINRGAVAVGAVEVVVAVPGEAEGIDLASAPELDVGAVRTEAEDVAAVEFEGAAVLALEGGRVVKTVRGIDPAVEAEAEAAAHAVGVFFVAERAEQDLAEVGFAIAVGIGEVPDVGDAKGDASRMVLRFVPREDAGGDVEAVGEVGDFIGLAIAVGVFEDFDGVATVFNVGALRVGPAGFVGAVRVFDGGGDPQTTARVEGEVDRFVDHWLAGEELDLEAVGDLEFALFLSGGKGLGLADEAGVGEGRECEGEEEEGEAHGVGGMKDQGEGMRLEG